MDEQYSLEKKVWTEADFDRMGWHDSRIYAIAFGNGVSAFHDMIFRWMPPTDSSAEDYQFWSAPATLIFHGVSKIEVEFGIHTSGQSRSIPSRATPSTL